MMKRCIVGVCVFLDTKNLGITRDGTYAYVGVMSVMTKIVDIPCG